MTWKLGFLFSDDELPGSKTRERESINKIHGQDVDVCTCCSPLVKQIGIRAYN